MESEWVSVLSENVNCLWFSQAAGVIILFVFVVILFA